MSYCLPERFLLVSGKHLAVFGKPGVLMHCWSANKCLKNFPLEPLREISENILQAPP